MTAAIAAVLLLAALAGAPLFVVLAAGALAAAYGADLDPAVLIIEMVRLAGSPNLVAIPLFTLAGVTLANGGAPKRLVQLLNALLGWLPGGLAVVALLSCAIFTAFTGASGVTILALGGLLYPMLLSEGYGKRHALGLLTTSGSLGLLFPPSLVVLLYGIVAQVSIEELFLAGVVPGAILLLMLAVYSMATGRGVRLPESVITPPVKLRTALRAGIWDLLLPIGVLVGLAGGYTTLTETAAFTAAYTLLLEILIHRRITPLSGLYAVFVESAVLVGSILIILGIAMGLTNLLIDAQLPAKLLSLVEANVSGKLEFLLWLNALLLIVGALMDIFSAIMVVVPLILPLAYRYGVDPVHLGIIFLANLEIGYNTPPVGINLFLASQRFKEPIFALFRATLPFLLIMLLWLAALTYMPMLTLWWRE